MNAAPHPAHREGGAEHALATALAGRIERWAREAGASAEAAGAAARAAHALSLATSGGDVCLPLDELAAQAPARDAAAWRALLQASGVVGSPEAPGAMPLLLDAQGRLYLHRHFDHERRLARRLAQAAALRPLPPDRFGPLRERLDRLFADNASRLPPAEADWQKLAAALALRNGLAVISGGPGTGKTTTVVHLLACLLELDPGCRIALAAPTGKAAARMAEAIRARAAHLPEALRARLPAEASTVHRLLGVRPDGGFVHHAGHPLAIDALVVDEASMLDLALATRLLEAVPPGARIVLLGDKDQLAAVESGAVFADLCADARLTPPCREALAALTGIDAARIEPPAGDAPQDAPAPQVLADSVIWFRRNFRFGADSGIARLAAAVRAGDAQGAVQAVREHAGAQLQCVEDSGSALGAHSLAALVEGYAGYVDALLHGPRDPRAVLDAFDRFRVLAALRDGPRGVAGLDAQIARRLRAQLAPLDADPSAPWYAGRPVLVLANDPLLKLYNGDVGIALPGADGRLAVHFPAPDGGTRAIAPLRLPRHESAFAMTVHKAQGSEFGALALVLPARASRVLTRELLYTAVTRARAQVVLHGRLDVLAAGIAAATRRRSGLLDRLRDAT
ncbi:MAG TPA: exodeoxyribonuclease V subunit alpha [Burkholderiaceae bacterium]|nr:exodeoxyribonuclease V subunit alpha [Burkholderiaceae bacterium]